jgi:hypothetical protein
MTKDEALRLALEALEMYELETNSEFQRNAITAIKASLETQNKPMHPQLKAMLEDYFDKCFAESASKRAWVGLTYEEIDELSRTMVVGGKSVNWLCYAIETKLKWKNT